MPVAAMSAARPAASSRRGALSAPSSSPSPRRCVRVARPTTATVQAKRRAHEDIIEGLKLGLFSTTLLAAPARADSVDDAISSVTSGLQAAGSVVKSGLGAAEVAVGYAKKAVDVVAPVAKTVIDASAPVLKETAETVSKAADPVLKSVAGQVPQAGEQIEKALSQQGINVKPVVTASTQAISSVKPAASSFFSWFIAQPLLTQAETVLGAAAIFYLGPPILQVAAGILQGYRGDISAAAALNTLTTEGNSVLVDIRRISEKESSGDPTLPAAAAKRAVDLEYSYTEDKKLRGLLANPDAVEAQITAMKIAALKRTSKGAPLILLDKNGSTAKAVAKNLAKLGYGKVFVISGGFDGRNGWVQSKLQVSLAKTVSTATVVPIATVIPKVITPISNGSVTTVNGSTTKSGTGSTSKKLPQRASKALPAPKSK